MANVANPLLTDTAEPELDPPGTFFISQGFLQVLVVVLIPSVPNANSTKFVLPKIIDFESIKSLVILASYSATLFSNIFEPAVVILFLISIRSLRPKGIPINLFVEASDNELSANFE